MSLQHDINDWYIRNKDTFSDSKITCERISDIYVETHPDCTHAWETVKKYVTWARAGKIRPAKTVDLDQIRQNVRTAYEAFSPAKVDLDPLGVLPDINKSFFDIPESYSQYSAPLKLDSYGKKLGVISDIHFPIHDRSAVLAAHAHLKAEGIDCLLLLGDIMDTSNLTRHAKRSSLNYTWKEELEVARAYVKSLRILFPNIPIVYESGNHESWMQQFLVRQAPQLENEYLLQERLHLAEYNIEWVDEYRLMTYGDLYLHHGHMLGIGGGRNVATRILDKHGVNLLVGHYHRQMTDEKTNLDGRLHAVWINGCLADQHPSYNPYGNSTHGCSIVNLNSDGRFHVQQFKILNGRVIG